MPTYKPHVGATVRALLNGLKQTAETVSPLIGVEAASLEAIMRGEQPLTEPIERALCTLTGINQRDFYPLEHQALFPVEDDTHAGVRFFRAQETKRSERTLTRGPDGTPYYTYADTALSNTSTFRPEWIQELYVEPGEDPDALPGWAFNKGHLEHQVTYFIGPVNFYWIDKQGKRHVEQMNTGDTNSIVPFTPHTFTTRKQREGIILAVTYGGAIASPAFRARIGALSMEAYLEEARAKMAALPPITDVHGAVIFRGREAHVDHQPNTRLRELSFQASEQPTLQALPTDRWVYNIDSTDIELRWAQDHTNVLAPGDSAFVRRGTEHAFRAVHQDANLVVVDILPEEGDPYAELAVIQACVGEEGLKRVHTETTRWY